MNASSCLNVASGVSVLYGVKFVTSWRKFGVTSIFLIESTEILNLGDFFSQLCLIYSYDVDNERLLKKQKQKETKKKGPGTPWNRLPKLLWWRKSKISQIETHPYIWLTLVMLQNCGLVKLILRGPSLSESNKWNKCILWCHVFKTSGN